MLVGYFKHPGMIAAVAVTCARRGLHGLRLHSPEPIIEVAAREPSAADAEPVVEGVVGSPAADAATLARWADEGPVTPSEQPGWWKLDGGYVRRQDVIPEKWAAWNLPPHPAERAARGEAVPTPTPPQLTLF